MNSTSDLAKKADELVGKIRRLIEKQDRMQQELKSKDEKIESLKQALMEKEQKIEGLENESITQKLGSAISLSEDNKKEVRKKINEYLKELDAVIAKLSAED